MADRRIHFDTQDTDPGAGLIAASLDGTARIVPMGRPENRTHQDEVWFSSQHAYLASVGQFAASPPRINVVLRRPGDDATGRSFTAELALIAALPDVAHAATPTYHALSHDAAQDFASQTGLNVTVLGPTLRPEPPSRRAVMNGALHRFDLHRGDDATRLSFNVANWARLARHYHLEPGPECFPDHRDMADLASRLPSQPTPERHFVFVTPNGVGLGHLTRQMAVADALQDQSDAPVRCTFWSFSKAAILARRAGHSVALRHTAEHLNADEDDWLAWETAAFAQMLRDLRPTAIITDGSRVEPFITQAMRQPGCHHSDLTWIRRGMWRPDADDAGLADARFCDNVLVPGDLASAFDQGATARADDVPPGLSRKTLTAPVVFRSRDPVLSKRAARRELGLKLGTYCLVSLGGDAFSNTASLQTQLGDIASRAKVRLVWAQSPLASRPDKGARKDRHLSIYPLFPYFRAFDGIISACGYNSFHELMLRSEAPILFLPTSNARLDDQPSRARFAAERGWASAFEFERGESLDDALFAFLSGLRKAPKPPRPDAPPNGADQMARVILQDLGTGGNG